MYLLRRLRRENEIRSGIDGKGAPANAPRGYTHIHSGFKHSVCVRTALKCAALPRCSVHCVYKKDRRRFFYPMIGVSELPPDRVKQRLRLLLPLFSAHGRPVDATGPASTGRAC